jgi:mTERF domain-containing protein
MRSCILTHLISSHSAAYPISPLRRLLSAVASRIPEFAVEQYLVGTCGLTRNQALKAAGKLSHLKSPANPDAVLAFLAGLGLSSADVAAVVAKDPKFLCAGVERTLAPIVTGLTGLGLSHTEIARIVPLAPCSFRCRSIVSNLPYFLSLYGSYEDLLSSDLERVVKPINATFLSTGVRTREPTQPAPKWKLRVRETRPWDPLRSFFFCRPRGRVHPTAVPAHAYIEPAWAHA